MCSTSIQTKTSTSVLISPSFGCSTNFSDHVISWSSLPARRANRTPSSARRRTSSAVHGRSAHGPAAYCRHYPTAQARWHRWRCPGWSFWSVLARSASVADGGPCHLTINGPFRCGNSSLLRLARVSGIICSFPGLCVVIKLNRLRSWVARISLVLILIVEVVETIELCFIPSMMAEWFVPVLTACSDDGFF